MRWPTVRVECEPRDLWIGIYWDRDSGYAPGLNGLYIYVCIVPCLPIVLAFLDNPEPS